MRANQQIELEADEAFAKIQTIIDSAQNIPDKKLRRLVCGGMDLQVFKPNAVEELSNGRKFQNAEVVLAGLQRKLPNLLAVSMRYNDQVIEINKRDLSELISSFLAENTEYKLGHGFNTIYRNIDVDFSRKNMLSIIMKVSDPDHAVVAILQKQQDGSVTFEFIDTYNEQMGRQSTFAVDAIRQALRQNNVNSREIFTTHNIQLPTTCEFECTMAIKRRAEDAVPPLEFHEELMQYDNRRGRVKKVLPADMEWAKARALENKLEELKQLGLIDPGINYVVVQHKVEKSEMMERLAENKARRRAQISASQAGLFDNDAIRQKRAELQQTRAERVERTQKQGELAETKAERQGQRNEKQAELNANKNERRRRNQ